MELCLFAVLKVYYIIISLQWAYVMITPENVVYVYCLQKLKKRFLKKIEMRSFTQERGCDKRFENDLVITNTLLDIQLKTSFIFDFHSTYWHE